MREQIIAWTKKRAIHQCIAPVFDRRNDLMTEILAYCQCYQPC